MSSLTNPRPSDDFHVALKSALAAGLFLGFPAGLLLWLILLQQAGEASLVDPLVAVLQVNGWNKIVVLVIGSLGWSYLLGRISGYRFWWKIGLATALGILAAWISPLANLDGILYGYDPNLPVHINFAAFMVGLVGGVTLCVGLAYGLLLRSVRAALILPLATSVVSVSILLLTIAVFAQFGIRVGGEVPFAMSKVTSVSLLLSAMAGGAVLGVGFSRFAKMPD